MPHEPKVGELPALPMHKAAIEHSTCHNCGWQQRNDLSLNWRDEDMLAFAEEAVAAEREARKDEARWISVDERLPKSSETVLAVSLPDEVDLSFYSSARDGRWRYSGDGDVRVGITHWMPFPTPPAALQAEQPESP